MNVSVIIPTYNRAGTLPRAIESVLNQSRPAMEVIVVDDGSSDATADLVREGYPEVSYIAQENRGVSSARNAGIATARGDWIAFVDSDDEWLADKLLVQTRDLKSAPEYRICHGDEIWVRRGRRVNPCARHQKHGGWIYAKCLPRCVISPSCVMLHRSIFTTIGGFDEGLPACEDYDLWLRVCARFAVLFCATPLIKKYGGHDDQLSGRYWGMDRFRVRALEKMLQRDDLGSLERVATRQMLCRKLGILRNGAVKHGNEVLFQECSEKLRRYDG